MAYAVENLEKLERRVVLTLPVAEISAEVEKRLKVRARTARTAGFRPGKVPLKMVAQMYGAQIHNDVINERINKALNEAVAENKLALAGPADIDAKTDDVPEGNVQFYATFEVIPEVKVNDLSALEVEKSVCEVTDTDVERTIDILRKRQATYQPKGDDAVAENGDRVTIDFVGKIDGVEFAGGKADGFPFVLGEKRMLPEFEAAIVGLKVGESKTFPLPFPENYHGADVAGKTAEFTVTLKGVELTQLPELTDEFCKQLGVVEGGAEKLREDIKKNLVREIKNRIASLNKQHVFNELVKANEFDIPKAMIEKEIDDLVAFTRRDLEMRNPEHKDDDLPRDMFNAQAESRVRLGLLLGELMKDNVLDVTPEQLKERAEEIASSYQQPQSVIDYYMNDANRRRELENILMEENAVAYIFEKAKVTEKAVAFEDLMAQQL